VKAHKLIIQIKSGSAYYSKGNHDRAVADYNEALRLDPNLAYARRNLEIARRRGK
jgi:tetratricopeptide (TPR) repeat protein